MDTASMFADNIKETCNQTIKQLEDLKSEIKLKQDNIEEQKKQFEDRLKKLASVNKSIKIDSKQKAALHEDCAQFFSALDNVIKEIDQQISSWNEFLSSEKSPLKTKEQDKLIFAAMYLKQRVSQTKKFIKRTIKNVSVAHSRFSFGFDSQQKQLNYLELLPKN